MLQMLKRAVPSAPPPPPPLSTEDDAVMTVGFFDAMATQNMRDLDAFETKLVAEIEAKTNALKAVREAKERGKALLRSDAVDKQKPRKVAA